MNMKLFAFPILMLCATQVLHAADTNTQENKSLTHNTKGYSAPSVPADAEAALWYDDDVICCCATALYSAAGATLSALLAITYNNCCASSVSVQACALLGGVASVVRVHHLLKDA